MVGVLALAGYFYVYPERAPGWLRETSILPPAATTTVYKWQDSRGSWQITDEPPAPGIEFETLKYQTDTNVFPTESD